MSLTFHANGKIDGIRITKAERYTGTSTSQWGNFDEPTAEWGTSTEEGETTFHLEMSIIEEDLL